MIGLRQPGRRPASAGLLGARPGRLDLEWRLAVGQHRGHARADQPCRDSRVAATVNIGRRRLTAVPQGLDRVPAACWPSSALILPHRFPQHYFLKAGSIALRASRSISQLLSRTSRPGIALHFIPFGLSMCPSIVFKSSRSTSGNWASRLSKVFGSECLRFLDLALNCAI